MTDKNPQLDDSALLWWYAKSEKERTDIELSSASLGFSSLESYIIVASGQVPRELDRLKEAAGTATDSFRMFTDACIDVGFWGEEADE